MTWPGWPSPDEFAAHSMIGVASRPYGTEVEEPFPPDDVPPLSGEEPAPPGFTATWDAAAGRFAEAGAQSLLERLRARDPRGEQPRLPFQPGVPEWVLAWRESVSRGRHWRPAESLRALLAGAFYRSFLRGAFARPDEEWPESNDVWCDNLYKSCASHGNGRSQDLGDRPDVLPKNWCGAAASAVLVEALRRGGGRLDLPWDFSDLVYRKDWNLDVTEYVGGKPARTPFVGDGNPKPDLRAGDIVTLALPEGTHFAMVVAASPDFLYVASGSTGPMRTTAIDLVRASTVVELNRTSLLLPTSRLKKWSKDGLRQLRVRRLDMR